MIGHCGECVFYEPDDNEHGWCGRYPPVFVGFDTNGDWNNGWMQPQVSEWNGCGEFKPKEAEHASDT